MNLMTNEWSRKPDVFSLFSRIKTPKGEIRNNENCPNVTHGKKYLVRGHDIRTERSEVRASWSRAKYLPVQPDQSQSISILSYDHLALKISKIWFSHSMRRYTGARGRTTKNIRQLKKIFALFFRVRAKISQFIEKRDCVFTPFSFKFLQQSRVSARPNEYGNYRLFTEVEVNSDGYLARCFAARWVSTTFE